MLYWDILTKLLRFCRWLIGSFIIIFGSFVFFSDKNATYSAISLLLIGYCIMPVWQDKIKSRHRAIAIVILFCIFAVSIPRHSGVRNTNASINTSNPTIVSEEKTLVSEITPHVEENPLIISKEDISESETISTLEKDNQAVIPEEEEKKEKDDILGLYLVHASLNEDTVEILACTSPQNLQNYIDSFTGDSDIDYIPSLTRTKQCEILNNADNYSIRVNRVVENNQITEIIVEYRTGEEKKRYVNLDRSIGIFHKNPYGEEAQKRDEEAIKRFEIEEKGKISHCDLAVYMCATPKDLKKHLFSKYPLQNIKNCFKIKSKTPVKAIDIDNNLFRLYEILEGEHQGKKLWHVRLDNLMALIYYRIK